MNVADLLQEAPSDDHRRRQEQRERDREAQIRDRNRDRDRDRDRDPERSSSFVTQFQAYDNSHRPRESMPFGSSGPAPAMHGQPYTTENRQTGGQSHPQPTPSSSHSSPLFMSPLAVPATGPAQPHQSSYHGEYSSSPRDNLGRQQNHGSLGKPMTVPLYPTPTGPMSERHRSVSLSRPRTPPFPEYGGHPMSNTNSQLQSTTSHPLSRSPAQSNQFSIAQPQRDPPHFLPLQPHPRTSSHKSPLHHAHGAQQHSLQRLSQPSHGPGGSGHVLESPAMGSLRPFEEQGFSTRAGPGSSAVSAMNPNSIPRDREKDRDRERQKDKSRDNYEKERDKDRAERDKGREKDKDGRRKVRPALNGNPSPSLSSVAAPMPSPSLAQGFGRSETSMQGGRSDNGQGQIVRRTSGEFDRERDREWERQRERAREDGQDREDMNMIRAVAPTRLQVQGPGQPQQHHLHHMPHRHLHPHHPSINSHPNTHQHSHTHAQPNSQPHMHSHGGHASKSKNAVLALAPPSVAIANPSNHVKEESLTLAPPPAPSSPTLPLQLAPGPPYQHQSQPPSLKQGAKTFNSSTPAGPGAPGGPQQIFPQQQYSHNHVHHSAQPLPMHHPQQHPNRNSIPPLPPLPQTQQHYQPIHSMARDLSPDRFASSPVSTQPALFLGTFVVPRTPFPYFFPSRSQSGERERRATIFVPNSFLPRTPPQNGTVPIWGGGLSANLYAYGHNPGDMERGRESQRRVYTDDSDVLLCALHAGKITWSGVQRARDIGRDLRVEVCIRREGRYVGGPGAVPLPGEEVDNGLENLDGEMKYTQVYGSRRNDPRDVLRSLSWGNGHDGSGIEVLSAEWVHRGTAHSLGRRNRTQRMFEYTERRSAMMEYSSDSSCVKSQSVVAKSRKRCKRFPYYVSREGYSVHYDVTQENDEKLTDERIVVFGDGVVADHLGFKYNPSLVRSILFPPTSPFLPSSSASDRPRRRKRRKLDGTQSNGAQNITDLDVDSDSAPEDPLPASSEQQNITILPARDLVLENDEETFLLLAVSSYDADKDNVSDGGVVNDVGSEGKGKRYHVFLRPWDKGRDDHGGNPAPPLLNGYDLQASGDASAAKGGDEPHRTIVNGAVHEFSVKDNGKPLFPSQQDGLPVDSAVDNAVEVTKRDSAAPTDVSVPIASAKTKSQSAKTVPLYRDICEEDVEFQDDGIAILRRDVRDSDAGYTEKALFIRVQRWRFVQSNRVH